MEVLMGHASITTTQRYARLSDDMIGREAARVMGCKDVAEDVAGQQARLAWAPVTHLVSPPER